MMGYLLLSPPNCFIHSTDCICSCLIIYLDFFIIFQFNPVSPLTSDDHGYNSSPSPDDRAHVVVFVFSACVSEIKDSVLMKMKAVRDAASNMGKIRHQRSILFYFFKNLTNPAFLLSGRMFI